MIQFPLYSPVIRLLSFSSSLVLNHVFDTHEKFLIFRKEDLPHLIAASGIDGTFMHL